MTYILCFAHDDEALWDYDGGWERREPTSRAAERGTTPNTPPQPTVTNNQQHYIDQEATQVITTVPYTTLILPDTTVLASIFISIARSEILNNSDSQFNKYFFLFSLSVYIIGIKID